MLQQQRDCGKLSREDGARLEAPVYRSSCHLEQRAGLPKYHAFVLDFNSECVCVLHVTTLSYSTCIWSAASSHNTVCRLQLSTLLLAHCDALLPSNLNCEATSLDALVVYKYSYYLINPC